MAEFLGDRSARELTESLKTIQAKPGSKTFEHVRMGVLLRLVDQLDDAAQRLTDSIDAATAQLGQSIEKAGEASDRLGRQLNWLTAALFVATAVGAVASILAGT